MGGGGVKANRIGGAIYAKIAKKQELQFEALFLTYYYTIPRTPLGPITLNVIYYKKLTLNLKRIIAGQRAYSANYRVILKILNLFCSTVLIVCSNADI